MDDGKQADKKAQHKEERRSISVPDTLLDRMVGLLEKEHRAKNLRFWLLVGAIIMPSLIYAVATSAFLNKNSAKNPDEYAAVVKIDGPIEDGKEASALSVLPALEAAFKDEKAKGVLLLINSPGGTPVQSGVIHDRILSLKEKYKKPVIAMGRDMMTSGAYMVAVAADKIYANEASLVGSIGVVIRGFGLSNVMDRYGVERRVYAAGKNKNTMDPFSPENPEDVEKTREMLAKIHAQFIAKVKAGRGKRLKKDDEFLFNGGYWTGAEAEEYGLIDGVADLPKVVMDNFGVEALKDMNKKDFFTELSKKFFGGFSLSVNGLGLESGIYAKSEPVQFY